MVVRVPAQPGGNGPIAGVSKQGLADLVVAGRTMLQNKL